MWPRLFEVAIQQALHTAAMAGLILRHLVDGVMDGVQVQFLGLLGQVHLAGAGAALGVNTHLQVLFGAVGPFPLRIGKVHLTIQSILRQSRPADRILLWLSKEEFPEEAQLPANLLRLKEKGLDIRSFKKVFYTAQEFENDVIVTADDDALYPENWLEKMVKETLT